MLIDDLPFGDPGEEPKLIVIKSSPRRLRFSPIVYKLMMHFLRRQRFMLRCRNYDEEGNKIRSDCSICLNRSNPPKPYYAFLGIDMHTGKPGWIVVPERLAMKIKIYHDRYEICDWTRGRTVRLSKHTTSQGLDWKIELSRERTPIEDRVRRRLESYTDTVKNLYPFSYAVVDTKGVPENAEEKPKMRYLQEEEEFVEISDKVPEEIEKLKNLPDEQEVKEENNTTEASEDNIDEESMLDTEDVIDEEDIDSTNIEFDMDVDSLAEEIEDDSIKSLNETDADELIEEEDIEFEVD